VRSGEEDAGPVLGGGSAKREALVEALRAVVSGRDHVGMDVPEHRHGSYRPDYSARR